MTHSRFRISISTGAIMALSILATSGANAQDSTRLNSYDTAHLQNFSAQLSQQNSFENSLQKRSDVAVGFGLNYSVKFGQNVMASETYGRAALNFNTDWQGKTGQAQLATLSIGSQSNIDCDCFGLAPAEDLTERTFTLNLLGLDLDTLAAGENDTKTKKNKGTDLGDVGLLAGGVGLLLIGGTVAILAADN